MDKELLLYSGFILFGTFISAISQVMLKKAAQKTYDSRIKEYLNPLVISAYFIFFLATLCTIFAYKVVPLSMGPVLEATSYIYVTIFGITIFKEKISKKKLVALLLIICGIFIYSILGEDVSYDKKDIFIRFFEICCSNSYCISSFSTTF